MAEKRYRRILRLPVGIKLWRIDWGTAISVVAFHIVAFASLVPWLFSWSGLILMCVGFYMFGTLGINVCYHRLLTHRSFTCPVWLERALTLIAFCNLQGSSLRWVAVHRKHHQHSDDRPDPHSPLADFIWSHVGWLVIKNPELRTGDLAKEYARDLERDPFHRQLDRQQLWLLTWLAHVVLFFVAGFAIGWGISGQAMAGVQLGASWILWAVIMRTICVWHITWAINSVTHLWGYRSHDTEDNSQNNWLLGYLGMGEGWHNNHHADQRSAAHGHRWWELDITYLTILFMEWIGLSSNVVRPSGSHRAKQNATS